MLDDDAPVEFSFSDGVMHIRISDAAIAMPADGPSWTQSYSVKAGTMRQLPVRLMRERVEISVWEAGLIFGNRRYNGVTAIEPKRRLPD